MALNFLGEITYNYGAKLLYHTIIVSADYTKENEAVNPLALIHTGPP